MRISGVSIGLAILVSSSMIWTVAGSAREEALDGTTAQSRNAASCSVDPNPVILGTNYQVLGINVGSSRPLQVRLTEGNVSQVFELVSSVEGTFSVDATSQLVGDGVVEVTGFRRNTRPYVLTRCLFAVVHSSDDPSGCNSGCGSPGIPPSNAWTDHGLFLRAGNAFEWDHILWGGFAANIVKRSGLFYFYYQGSLRYDEFYETVAFRTVGVATSNDGIHFAKYPGNPVLSWSPNAWLEEGAVSAAPLVTSSGSIGMFYGANTAVDSWRVSADGRFALSEDGYAFRDLGVALNHTDRTIWGSGDELFPIVSFSDGGMWYVYYLPNGTSQSRTLGVAWGSDPLKLSSSAGVVDDRGARIPAWGPGSAVPLGGGNYALFINNGGTITVWQMNVAAPDRLTGPIATYAFSNMRWGSLLLDGNTWYLYYINDTYDAYGVRTAPAY